MSVAFSVIPLYNKTLGRAQDPRTNQGRSQDFLKGGAQPSLARQTISPACQMYCARITGDLSAFSLET